MLYWQISITLCVVVALAQKNIPVEPVAAIGAVSYSLVGSVELTDISVVADSDTLSQCGKKCSDRKRPPCVAFTWLSADNIDETTLANSSVGECRLLECVPDEKTKRGAARLYVRVQNSVTPQFGVVWKVPEDYRRLCTFAYRAYQTKLNFTNADAACRKDGGRLLFTRTLENHLEVNSNLNRSIPHWIGMADIFKNRTFLWLDGSDIGAPKWDSDQPNNYRGGTNEAQTCVMVQNGAWNDEQCSREHSFVCQIIFVDV
ncbi:C-type lectin-like [Trinorchestia longiramus]|nr:C-type lectin-like [Trinorchestia longiramus]